MADTVVRSVDTLEYTQQVGNLHVGPLITPAGYVILVVGHLRCVSVHVMLLVDAVRVEDGETTVILEVAMVQLVLLLDASEAYS